MFYLFCDSKLCFEEKESNDKAFLNLFKDDENSTTDDDEDNSMD